MKLRHNLCNDATVKEECNIQCRAERYSLIVILILNNVAVIDVVADMLWTVKTTERIQLVADVMIMMWHWDDVSVNE